MFIKNKIMVSLKKYIIKWLKILQTPIVEDSFILIGNYDYADKIYSFARSLFFYESCVRFLFY